MILEGQVVLAIQQQDAAIRQVGAALIVILPVHRRKGDGRAHLVGDQDITVVPLFPGQVGGCGAGQAHIHRGRRRKRGVTGGVSTYAGGQVPVGAAARIVFVSAQVIGGRRIQIGHDERWEDVVAFVHHIVTGTDLAAGAETGIGRVAGIVRRVRVHGGTLAGHDHHPLAVAAGDGYGKLVGSLVAELELGGLHGRGAVGVGCGQAQQAIPRGTGPDFIKPGRAELLSAQHLEPGDLADAVLRHIHLERPGFRLLLWHLATLAVVDQPG